jgi:diguanylate cyclase (GGDEF)-like protein
MKNKSRNKNMLVFNICTITIVLIFLQYSQVKSYNQKISDQNDELLEHHNHQISTIINNYNTAAEIYYDETIKNNESIAKIIAAANTANDSEKNILREDLYDQLESTYQNANENHFRQFHFHLKDCTSFLRFHKPEKFGDNLEGIRDTVCNTRDTHAFTYGFEEGKIYNGFRFVFPLFMDNEYIGSMEASVSPNAITKVIEESCNISGSFIIKKSVTDKKVEADLINTYYLDSDISSKYYYDKEIYEQFFDAENQAEHNFILNINEKIKSGIENDLEVEEDFVIDTEIDDLSYSVSFFAIDNFKEEHVGYFVFYDRDYEIQRLKTLFLINISLASVLWIALISIRIIIYKSEIKLMKLSITDGLTGLLNRRGFFLSAQVLYKYSQRMDGLWICFMDVDKLKTINDLYGHEEGDKAIIAVADILRNSFRKSDVIGRIGGDEFAICGFYATESDESFIKRIDKKLESFNKTSSKPYSLSVSKGCLMKSEDMKDATLTEIIAEADRRMYASKINRRKNVS